MKIISDSFIQFHWVAALRQINLQYFCGSGDISAIKLSVKPVALQLIIAMRENSFLCLGSPLVDIIATVNGEFLSTYNLKPNNAVAANESNIQLFDALKKLKSKYQAGGCALNTATTFQWVLKTPKLSVVVGAVGTDNYRDILKECLNKEIVNYKFVEVEGAATGKCAVLLTDDNRSLCTDLGASKFFEVQHLNNKLIWAAIENAQHYYVPGFFLGVSVECLMIVARHSVTNGKTFAFNLSAPFLSERYKDEIIALLPMVDLLFGNESEARAFARALDFNSNDLQEIVLYINNFQKVNAAKKMTTIITRGPNPVCLATDNILIEYPADYLEKGSIKDTSAAGDAFVGGFMAEFVRNKPLDQCVLSGIHTAGKIIQNIGCSF